MANPSMYSGDILVGFPTEQGGNITQGFQLNAAGGKWVAYVLQPTASKTINEVTFNLSAVTGTLSAGDLQCDIYSTTASGTGNTLVTGTLLGSTTTISSVPTTSGFYKFTGLSVATTRGVGIMVVFKNNNATPTTNFPTFRYFVSNQGIAIVSGINNIDNVSVQTTTNGGTLWSAVSNTTIPNVQLKYSDNTYDGFVGSNLAKDTTNMAYNNKEIGVKFTTPSGVKYNVLAASMNVSFAGTPTGQMRYRIYKGTTLVATSSLLTSTTEISTWLKLWFSSPVVLLPNTTYRLTVSVTSNSDAVGNGWQLAFYTAQNDANTLSLKPMNGTATKTFFDGTSWTDTSTDFPAFSLILDTTLPFTHASYNYGNPQ